MPVPTGDEELVHLARSLQIGDVGEIAARTEYVQLPCEAPRPVAPQPLLCREGKSPGDLLEGIWVSHVEAGLWGPENAPESLARQFAGRELFGIWRFDTQPVGPYGSADIAIVFVGQLVEGHQEYHSVLVRDRRIVAAAFAWPPEEVSTSDVADPRWILPPPPQDQGDGSG